MGGCILWTMNEDISDAHAATRRCASQELIYPTTLRLRGPWLLEMNRLLALDEILEQFCSRDTEQIDSGVALPRGFENEKSLTIVLSKDHVLKTSSFKDAISHIGSQDEVATGFEYVATTVNTRVSVRLSPRKK